MKKESFQKLVLTGVFAALSYVVFTFLQILFDLSVWYQGREYQQCPEQTEHCCKRSYVS